MLCVGSILGECFVCMHLSMQKKKNPFISPLTELQTNTYFFLIWICYYFAHTIAELEPISINLPGVLGVHQHFTRGQWQLLITQYMDSRLGGDAQPSA